MAHRGDRDASALAAMPVDDDGVPRLNEEQVNTLLAHARVGHGPPSADYLARLQWAWLCAQPFHNLDLLAGFSDGSAPVSAQAALARTLAGLGGPCHVQAVSMAALLRALGFSNHLAAATINAPGDHLVNVVAVADQRLVCDVGNGHPYARPFPLDRRLEQERCGWRFISEPAGDGLRLRRLFTDGREIQVYTVDLAPRTYGDFASIIEAHHQHPEFGPFLTGLRAVRMHERVLLTLRDGVYQRHSELGATTRTVADEAACIRLLNGPFQLAGLPVGKALDILHENGKNPWRGGARPHGRKSVTRAVYSVTTTDRPTGLRDLCESIVADLQRCQSAGVDIRVSESCAVTLVIVENSRRPENRQKNATLARTLRASGLSVLYEDDGTHGRSIAESRAAQQRVIRRICTRGQRPELVWMLDDDMVLQRLVLDAEGPRLRTDIAYLDTWRQLADERPDISVAIGPYTGDPPIPLDGMLRTQLADLCSNLDRFAALAPDAIYPTRDQRTLYALPDYYYDHSRRGDSHIAATFAWEADHSSGPTVREQFAAMIKRAGRLIGGGAITRPLVTDCQAPMLSPTRGLLRGGNTVFFDIDACLIARYPSVRLSGRDTRRSDMIGAALLDAEGVWPVWHAGPAVLHQRGVDAAPWVADQAEISERRARLLDAMRSEFFGVLLTRLVMESPPTGSDADRLCEHVHALARRRSERIIGNLTAAGQHIDALIGRLDGSHSSTDDWWADDETLDHERASLTAMLVEIRDSMLGGATAASRAQWCGALQTMHTDGQSVRAIVDAYMGIFECAERVGAAPERANVWPSPSGYARGADV